VVLGFQFLGLRPKARRLIEAFICEHGQFRLRDEAADQDHAT
jgi:hypothetical protein